VDEVVLARRTRLRWTVVSSGVLFVGLGGYLGFVTFIESGSAPGVGAGVMGLAMATGFAAFFSPCSFPLLLTFLSRQYETGSRQKVFMSSLVVGLGAVAFLAVVGLILAVAGESLTRIVGFDTLTGRIFRASIGALLLFLGLRQANLIKVRDRVFDSIAGSSARRFDPARYASQTRRDFVYGFGYLLAGFG
jgi:cytochrome c biogenesis protein CcdA